MRRGGGGRDLCDMYDSDGYVHDPGRGVWAGDCVKGAQLCEWRPGRCGGGGGGEQGHTEGLCWGARHGDPGEDLRNPEGPIP